MKSGFLSEHDIYRIIRDLFRYGSENSQRILPLNADFTDSEWAVDSIEMMSLAATVNEMFHLYKTGLEDNLLRFKRLDKWVEIVSFSWRGHSDEITFRTSGSTKVPQPCTHSLSTLIQEAEELSELFSDRKRILSMVPCHHIYGFLFTVLLPRQMGIEVMDARDAGIGKLASELRSGDLIISFPLHWSYLEQSLTSWPPGVCGVSSSGPINKRLIRALQEKGIDKIFEVYGSSETAGIGFRHDPDAPFTLFSYWHNSDNPSVEKPEIIRTLPDGQSGAETLLPDLLQWETSRTFRLLTRLDGAVQVGGTNVYPEKISEKIRRHPLVADCRVRLMEETEIPRLKAFIVPIQKSDPRHTRNALNQWITQNFSPAERPVHLTFGKNLPQSQMGKVADWHVDFAKNSHELN